MPADASNDETSVIFDVLDILWHNQLLLKTQNLLFKISAITSGCCSTVLWLTVTSAYSGDEKTQYSYWHLSHIVDDIFMWDINSHELTCAIRRKMKKVWIILEILIDSSGCFHNKTNFYFRMEYNKIKLEKDLVQLIIMWVMFCIKNLINSDEMPNSTFHYYLFSLRFAW